MSARRVVIPLFCLVILLQVACGLPFNQGGKSISQAQAVEAAWADLEPLSNSHNRANWQVIEARQVKGSTVADTFKSGSPGCPVKVPANQPIEAGTAYWYLRWKPALATAAPTPKGWSPTAPPLRPEPFIYEAHLLVNAASGRVIARSLKCVVY